MNIVVLHGSARKKGNTAKVLDWAEDTFRSAGHSVERIALASKDIKGCLGCAKCKERPDEIGCVQKDDAADVLEKMIGADVTLFASPVYFWGFTAQVKALIDRSWSLVTHYHEPTHASLLEGTRQALLLTGGGVYDHNAEGLVFAFNKLQGFYKTTNAGELFIGKCSYDGVLPEDAEQRVREFALGVVK